MPPAPIAARWPASPVLLRVRLLDASIRHARQDAPRSAKVQLDTLSSKTRFSTWQDESPVLNRVVQTAALLRRSLAEERIALGERREPGLFGVLQVERLGETSSGR
jgi:hypothetical protein